LLTHKHQVDNNTEEILTQNKYNELSQVESKKVGGTNAATPLQVVDYTYNIRGWMTKVNNPTNLNGKLFAYEMKYNNPTNTSLATGKHNGNIAEVDWRTSQDDVLKRYSYQYDPLNRLLNGLYSEPNASVPENNFFSESLEYDINGNISKLYRNSKNTNGLAEQIDRLTYIYLGNQLTSVTDGSTNYKGYPDVSGNTIAYDANGNMINQKDKGILQIRYNYLNLPNYLEFDRQYFTRNQWSNENVYNFYRADGIKFKKEHRYSENSVYKKKTIDYLDGFQYETIQNVTSPILKFVPTAEGYFNFENNKYIYNYTDHLGNVRISYLNNGSGAEVLEENNYYPFGLKHEGYNALAGNPAYKYQYNGKELQQESGMYDYGARFYMPDLGRWGVVDPLAEKYFNDSPYVYTANDPINLIDPNGESWEPINKKGEVVKLSNKENIAGYRWVDYNTDKNGNKVARENTVETAYVFGAGGMTTLTSEGYKANQTWQAYEDISTGSESTDKKIASLHPSIQNQMKSFLLMAKYRFDVDLRVTDGFRSVEEQDKLYAKGRTAPGSIVTKAKGGQSNHNFGLAVDVVPMENGKLNWETKNWDLIGRIGESRGLEWGGRWKFLDRPHFQNLQGKTLKQLQALPKKNGLPILRR